MFLEQSIRAAGLASESQIARFRAVGISPTSQASALAGLAGGGLAVGHDDLMGGDSSMFADEAAQHFRGWVFASIRPIAQTIAGQPIRVAREIKPNEPGNGRARRARKEYVPTCYKSRAEELELFESHELLDTLAEPNPIMVQWHLLYVTVASLELTGKSHWWLTTGEDGKRIIWPIPGSWIRPRHEKSKPFASWLLTPGGVGSPIPIPAEEIVYFYYPDPNDSLSSRSPLGSQSRAVLADEAIQEAQQKSFQNGIWPGYAIIAGDISDIDDGNQGPPLLEQEQRQQLYHAIMSHYANVMHSGEPIILDAMIKDIKKVTNTPHEMDFQRSGQTTKARITQGFGVHPFIMGDQENANRASSHAARSHFADFCINPKVELISQVMTRAIGPTMNRAGEKLFIYVEPYQPDDREQTRKDVELAAKHYAVSRNEIRQILPGLRLPSMEDGGDLSAMPGAWDFRPVNGDAVPTAEAGEGAAQRAIPFTREPFAKLVAHVKSVWLKGHGRLEKEFQATMVGLFTQQRESVLSRFWDLSQKAARRPPSTSAEGIVDQIFNVQEWYELFEEAIRPHVFEGMLEGAAHADAMRKTFAKGHVEDLIVELDPKVTNRIEEAMQSIMDRPYWNEMQNSTRQALSSTLAEGMANNESLSQLAARIGDSPTVPGVKTGVLGSESNTVRALRIARTETTNSLNSGHFEQHNQLASEGIVQAKAWSATLDNFTRGSHIHLHGKRAPGDFPTSDFIVGSTPAPYPGHPDLPAEERVNCRCTIISVDIAKPMGSSALPTEFPLLIGEL